MQGRQKFIKGILLGCAAFLALTSTSAYAVITHTGNISQDTVWDNTDTHTD